MPSSTIVWDIETVPDLLGFAGANALIGRSDDEVRAEVGDKFSKLIYHSIACIGALVALRQEDHWAVSAVGAPNSGERPEGEIISAFVKKKPPSWPLSWSHSTGPPSGCRSYAIGQWSAGSPGARRVEVHGAGGGGLRPIEPDPRDSGEIPDRLGHGRPLQMG